MVSVERLDCGTLRGALKMFEVGAEGDVTLPVSAWLVRHPKGTALFDTGMPASFAGGCERATRVSRIMAIDFADGDTVGARLAQASQEPSRIDFVVVSHLHFDHVGGLSMIPNATVVVQRSEWRAGMAVEEDASSLHRIADYDLGHTLRPVDGEHDLFGDGAVTCIPTPGHTVGHQSLRVRLDSGDVVLTADCCYFARTLDGGRLPSFGHDMEQQRQSLARLRALRNDGATIVPGHDIEVVRQLPKLLD